MMTRRGKWEEAVYKRNIQVIHRGTLFAPMLLADIHLMNATTIIYFAIKHETGACATGMPTAPALAQGQ
jgi:hypothetical protein